MNFTAEEMAIDESPLDTDRAEIPWEASEALASWDRTLGNADRKYYAMLFTRAASEVLRLAKPVSTPEAWQQLVDDLHGMGRRHGLADAVVQTLMAAATNAPRDNRFVQPEDYRLSADTGGGADVEPIHEPTGHANSTTSAVPRFVPVAIDDVIMSSEPPWLIDGLLPARGLACVVGPPKSGKSFLTSDMLCSVARGVLYAGRTTVQGPVVYLTGEGVSGFKRRLVAMRRHHGIEGEGIPFYMVENVPDLGSEQTDLPQLLRELDDFIAQRAPGGLRAIVLDTLARCMGEADENSARDMGRFVNRCSAIERRYGCVVVVVHHVGKDASRGGRGSNSLNGAADVTMLVEKTEAFSTVRVEEMKDGREGQEWRFHLLPYLLSETSDIPSVTSPEVTTCVVELLSEPNAPKPRETKKVKQPRGVTGDLLKVIRRAIEEAGQRNVEDVAVPNNVRTVSRANLKRYCTTMDWQDPESKPESFRVMLNKNLSALRSMDLIGFDRDWTWLI